MHKWMGLYEENILNVWSWEGIRGVRGIYICDMTLRGVLK